MKILSLSGLIGIVLFFSSCGEPDNDNFRKAILDYYSVNNIVTPTDDLNVEVLEVISIENKNEWDVFATVGDSKKYRYRIKKLDTRLQVINIEETKSNLEPATDTKNKVPARSTNP